METDNYSPQPNSLSIFSLGAVFKYIFFSTAFKKHVFTSSHLVEFLWHTSAFAIHLLVLHPQEESLLIGFGLNCSRSPLLRHVRSKRGNVGV